MTGPIHSNSGTYASASSGESADSHDKDYACAHNGRPGTSVRDVLEHMGNKEWGSAAAEAYDIATEDKGAAKDKQDNNSCGRSKL